MTRFRTRLLPVLGAVVAVLVGSVALTSAAPVPSTDKLYTLDEDFDLGTLVNVNHDAPNSNQLQLNRTTTFFPFVNIAASARGTIIRADVNDGTIVGEWLSAPNGMGRNPSRTTVDRLGNVWFGNRAEFGMLDGEQKGSVGRIGVVLGGERSDADGSPNPAGAYLKPPFAYNTCRDRDNDGLIKTSRGLGDIRPWTNTGGVDSDGGVETADDECIINYTRVAGTGTRTVAVDQGNDLWTGGADTDHEKLSGATGQPIPGTKFNLGCGGYGGLIDKTGTLWSARFGNNLLRYVPGSGTGTCLNAEHGDYGLGMDPDTGEIWHTTLSRNRVVKLNSGGNILGSFFHGNTFAQGVAVDREDNVWVAHSLFNATTVGHLRTDGTYVGNVALPGGNGPTGVAIDSNGKVWVANINTNNAMRIDPNLGPVGGGGFHVGAVDLVVDLGQGAGPYNYSDMTGSVLGEVTAPTGHWSVVQDSGNSGHKWGRVTWNTEPQGSEPPGTGITVEARAADSEADLASQPYTSVSNGTQFSLTGRYIEVKATLTAAPDGTSPVLSDIHIEDAERDGSFSCRATGVRVGTTELSVSNPPDVPCRDDQAAVARARAVSGTTEVTAEVAGTKTDQTPDDPDAQPPADGDASSAHADAATVIVRSGLNRITVRLLEANAMMRCEDGQPKLSASGRVASLAVNGRTIAAGSGKLTIPLIGATLHINHVGGTDDSITRRAIWLDNMLGPDVVVGEAKANHEGNPCLT